MKSWRCSVVKPKHLRWSAAAHVDLEGSEDSLHLRGKTFMSNTESSELQSTVVEKYT